MDTLRFEKYVRLKTIEDHVAGGADLTKQLLGFSQGGRYDVKPVSMNEIVNKVSAMFGRTKKEISIRQKYSKDPFVVEVDRSQKGWGGGPDWVLQRSTALSGDTKA